MSTENGSLILNDQGTSDPTDDTVTYSPRATYNGSDSFTYTLEDENGDTVTTTVNIMVRPIVPVPVDDTASVDKNSSNNVISVLSNDDFGGNEAHAVYPLTFNNGSSTSASNNGATLSIEDNSTPNDLTDDVVFYTPFTDFTGEDTFQYTITDSDGDATTATVTVTVVEGSNGNQTPTANADTATVNAGSTDNVIDVLANDLAGLNGYIDGGLTMTNGTNSGSSTNGGAISIDNKGTVSTLDDEFKYSAPVNFTGDDTFSYTITDASGDASTAEVTVTVVLVADAPSAIADAVTVNQDSSGNLITVLANDSFGTDGAGSLSLSSGASAEGGTLSVNDNGKAGDATDDKVSYSPAANFVGTDTFTYIITDSNGDTATGTVTVTVAEVVVINGTPTAVADAATVNAGSTENVIDVTDNDDYGSDGVSATHPLTMMNGALSNASTNGGVISVSNGNILYSAPVNFTGDDTFSYTITDASGDASTAEVTVTVVVVADTPSAIADAVTVNQDSSGNLITVLANDSFGTDGAGSLSLSSGASAEGGALSVNDNGTAGDATDDKVSYSPAANFVGTDTFTYIITDSNGDTATGTVTVTVAEVVVINGTPTAVADTEAFVKDSIDNIIDVTANDDYGTDGPNATHPLTMMNGALSNASTNGGVISVSTGTILYTPPTNFTGTDTFSYKITNASGDASTATVTITIAVVKSDADAKVKVIDDATNVFENKLLVYPNPSKGHVKSTLFSTIDTKASVFVFDITGKVIYNSSIDVRQGKNEFELNLNVKPGIMFLKVISSEVNFGISKIVFK